MKPPRPLSWLDSQPKAVAAFAGFVLLAELFLVAWRARTEQPVFSYAPIMLRRPFHPIGGKTFGRWVGLAIPFAVFDDQDGVGNNAATVLLFEDGVPLGPGHAPLLDIELKGHGRYRYIQRSMRMEFVFSASDNSDPDTNGRTYVVYDPQAAKNDPYPRTVPDYAPPK